MKEQTLRKQIQLKTADTGARLFRNNVGTGWTGKVKDKGDLKIISDPRPFHAGLCKGSSDLIGWTPVEITPDMVGQKVAVFTAVELKSGPHDKTTKQQDNFLEQVRQAGGIGLVGRDADTVVNFIKCKQ